MRIPMYMRAKDSGSRSDYAFEISSSMLTPYKYINDINLSDSGSGIINLSSSRLFTPKTGSTRDIADRVGLINSDRRQSNGEHYGSGNSYIWDAWGTGVDDVWFMQGTSSHGYYNQDFEYKVIGDIETWSSSFHVHNTGSEGTDITHLDYSDIHVYNNKTIVDTGKGFSHRAYTPSGSDVNSVNTSSFIDGRPIGRTHYFVTSSGDVTDSNTSNVKPAGDILYPPNHYIIAGTSKNSMGDGQDHMNSRGYVGSQFPIPSKYDILQGGALIDPTHLDSNTTGSVTVREVVGSNTDQSIVVVKQGGIKGNKTDNRKSG
tara:strand:- start:11 stop:958 length:948 start_codon:yes stop_codon:yes gene_type:complete